MLRDARARASVLRLPCGRAPCGWVRSAGWTPLPAPWARPARSRARGRV